jgi:hypothetical protein
VTFTRIFDEHGEVLAVRPRDAPAEPGVYFLLAADTELLYAGKATNLRKRLSQHARSARTTTQPRLAVLYDRTREVRWETMRDEQAAQVREADVIVALRPRFNASYTDQGRWNYVTVDAVDAVGAVGALGADGAVDPGSRRHRIALTRSPTSLANAHGCFPHLGRGVSSLPAIACSDGYTALLRLLWVAASGGTRPIPSALSTGRVPHVFDVELDGSWRTPLRSLLSGTSSRLLAALAAVPTPDAPHLRPGLARDAAAAHAFFRHGPAAVRQLRRRHGVASRTVDRARIEELVALDLAASIGPFLRPRAPDPSTRHLGRHAHPWVT